jgi:manganese/zinc/iron transport system substrate-binding protein
MYRSALRHRSLPAERIRRFISICAPLLILAITLSACGKNTKNEVGTIGDRQINAVATTGMVGDIVKNIGGDRVTVKTLMGAGVDPHLYKASENDLRTLEEADIVFYTGLHLEGGLTDVFEQMADQIRTQAVTDLIPKERLLSPPEFEGNYDPHVWFDVTLWSIASEQVRDTLMEIDPDHATDYQARAETFLAQLTELDAYVITQTATIPPEQRVLITAHDAFGYFGARYGFEVHGLQGVSTATEAGTRDVQELADFIVERKIAAIFVESSVPRRTVEALQEAVKSRGWDVQIGGELFSDAMGDEGTVEGTYIGMVRSNIDVITSALRGISPGEE